MQAGELFKTVHVLSNSHWNPSLKITRLVSDSRSIAKGDVFVACPGERMDGHDFIGQAIQAGASCIVYESELRDVKVPESVMMVQVKEIKKAYPILLRALYGFPDKTMKLIGVTGTNGKTTIAYALYQLVKETKPAAYIGTLGMEGSAGKSKSINTTPGPEVLFEYLAKLADEGNEYCFMEVSSHALEQGRVYGLEFELVLFTQLTQDHLDYHYTMERYYQSKRKLFDANPRAKQMLINKDCEYGRRLLDEFLEAKSFSLNAQADYQVFSFQSTMLGSSFEMGVRGKKESFKTPMPMKHNISNLAGVIGCLDLLGFDLKQLKKPLEKLQGIDGRLERIGDEDFVILVDYAHTPDAIENVLMGAKDLRPGRILTLFGCGGDRDQEKRPKMTHIASLYSDILVLTEDNPRSENPEKILEDMKRGLTQDYLSGGNVYEVLDRRKAIEKVISLAGENDLVLVLGKGHEDYQILGDEKVPFDDREVIRDCLAKRGASVFSS